MRHPLVDVAVVNEVLVESEYALPGGVMDRLAALGRPPRVLDLGGNIGLFALRMFELFPRAEVTSYEPDPVNLQALERCAAANRMLAWRIVPAAAGTTDGDAEFISDFALGQLSSVAAEFGGHTGYEQWLPPERSYARGGATTVRVRDVLPDMLDTDLLKTDIEGAEWDILEDPRFAQTNALALVLEAHPHPGESAAFVEERLRAVFERARFERVRAWEGRGGAEIVWAARDANSGQATR